MTTASARPTPARLDRAHASALPSVPGVPWYGAVLIALVLTAIGAVIGGSDYSTGVPGAVWVFFLAGAVLAALAVRRRAVFTAMVQPPLIAAVVVFLGGRMFGSLDTVFSGINVVKIFPMMLIGTGIAVILGLVRIAAQPLRSVARPTQDESAVPSATRRSTTP